MAAANQLPLLDFCKIGFITQLRSTRWISDYAVIEIFKVKSSDLPSEMNYCFVPNEVQGSIEQSCAACRNELRKIKCVSALRMFD